MRVVLDGRGILNRLDGIGRYSVNLIRELVRKADGIEFSILMRDSLKAEFRELLPA